MRMSNSPLVSYTKISPNSTNPRTNTIKKITIHHMAGNLSVETCGSVFASASRQASSNYGVGTDGRIGMYVEEKNRSWCSSSRENDHQAVTIEVANDGGAPDWHVSDKALAATIDLCVDICQRNGIDQLNYTGDKNGNLTEHNYFAATACPGPYLKSKLPYIASEVNKRLKKTETPSTPSSGFQATSLKGMPEADIVAKMGPLFTQDQKKSGVLASVSMAQFILESSYGKSELAQNANNCFGMKVNLSGNTWSGSAWDGTKYEKKTQEYSGGKYITVTAEFRKYACIEDSIADHSAYLLGAMNGSKKRYDGLKGLTDYKKAIQLIKDGGYATSPTYVESLCAVVEKWNLTQYDIPSNSVQEPEETTEYPVVPFLVKVIVDDLNYRSEPSMSGAVKGQTKKGIFTIVEVSNGWGKLKSGAGWIWLGNSSYCTIVGEAESTPSVPFLVKVGINNLNIRKGPGTNYNTNGFTGKGIFTIVEVSNGWGKLKSGAGWISLSYTTLME